MTYTTKSGDMWDAIAYKQLGSVNYVDLLMNLNTAYRNSYIFPSGIVLTLPDVPRTVGSSLPPWTRKGSTGGDR